MDGEASAGVLLDRFERVLESDPEIDEIGFVHPSQFVKLNEEACHSLVSSDSVVSDVVRSADGNTLFWIRDHKLGISTEVLIPLYKEAKCALMAVNRQYKALSSTDDVSGVGETECTSSSLMNSIESEVMKHSRVVLLLSSDFATSWHSRKIVLSKKHMLSDLLDELQLSALVLSYAPKSEQAWSHRRWVIKEMSGKYSTAQEIVTKESELVEKIAERSKMNYRAWYHRCWLVSYMTREQLLHELKRSRNWAGLHVADHSCFHYRRQLILRILEHQCTKQENASSSYSGEIYQLWKEELDWNDMLIKRYVGREALWLHRRFLSLLSIKHFLNDDSCLLSHSKHKTSFMDNELHLHQSCSMIPDNNFDDYQAQAIHSTTYMLWLIKHIPDSSGMEFREKLRTENLKALLNKACPEKSRTWDSLIAYVETCDDCEVSNYKL